MYREQLQYFALAYQLRSFSAAAKKIPMSSQGLAKAVHSLESELEVILFESDSAGRLRPTPQADLLLDFVSVFENNYANLRAEYQAMRAAERHELRVGIGLGILGYLGPDFIQRFRRKHPRIAVRYEELNDCACDIGLKAGRFDIALTVAPYSPDFLTYELYSTPMYFWISAEDELASHDRLHIEDFLDRRISMPGEEFKCNVTLRNMAKDAGIEFGEVYATAEIFRMFDFARTGKGLGFSAKHLVEMDLFARDSSVVALPLEDVTWRFGIAQLSSRKPTPEMKAFTDYCIEAMAA